MLKFLRVPLPPPPSPQDRLHEQKHLGRPSSHLGGAAKGGPGGALTTRCGFLGGRKKQEGNGSFHRAPEKAL